MPKMPYNSPRRIAIRERERWFKYYNVLKQNHLVNFLIIRGLNKVTRDKWDIKPIELYILIIIYLYRSKSGAVTYSNIMDVINVAAPGYNKTSLSHDINRLVRVGHMERTKLGHYTLTASGINIIVSFQRHFFKTYENLNSILPETN